MSRPKTLHRGADDERAAIKAYLRRFQRTIDRKATPVEALGYVIDWIDQRTVRNKKKAGGL